MRLLKKQMKKNLNFAKKLMIFCLLLMFSLPLVKAQNEGENSEEYSMEEECGRINDFMGCLFKRECRWHAGECKPKSDVKELKAKNKWKESYCTEKVQTTDQYGEPIETKELRFLKQGPGYSDREVSFGGLKVKLTEACQQATAAENDSPCNYPSWLSNEGKRKCRHMNNKLKKAEYFNCRENAEIKFQTSLKSSEDRQIRNDELAECDSQFGFLYENYDGPVFNGPGLRGGSQMAGRELSSSISKQRDLKKLIIDWAKFVLEISLVLAVVAIIWAGIRFITDMGDGAGVEAAKKIIMWTVVGLIVILGSYAIVNTVLKVSNANLTSQNIQHINQILT